MEETNFPQTNITNGIINARILLPDLLTGYYRGVRFDWSGNTESLEWDGHSYFGKWFSEYRPEIHDVIMGPVEEFTALDYHDIQPGGRFVKIGVGVLQKPDDEPYAFARSYKLMNPGKWTYKSQPDHVQFLHELDDTLYSYRYEKTVRLNEGKPELTLEHTIINTGTKTIDTTVYDHNFFMLDKQLIGTTYAVLLPFKPEGDGIGINELAKLEGKKIVFLRNLNSGEQVFCPALTGFGNIPDDYEIRIENYASKAGVKITCDQPLVKLAFWCCRTTICPEPYIRIKAEPGKEFRWTINYHFYILD
jgi:hypothetical protein